MGGKRAPALVQLPVLFKIRKLQKSLRFSVFLFIFANVEDILLNVYALGRDD